MSLFLQWLDPNRPSNANEIMNSNRLSRFTRSTVHQDNEPCRNCAKVFCGNYCPNCGQEALTGAPTTMGFIYEFLTRNILERGKLPKTLWQLLRYPGSLTVDFLEGRRQRFIRPVRLYFGLSVLYFLLLSLTSNFSTDVAKNFGNPGRTASEVDQRHLPQKNPASNPAIAAAVSKSDSIDEKPSQDVKQRSNPTFEPKIEVDAKELEILDKMFPRDVSIELKKRISRFSNLPERDAVRTLSTGMMHQASKVMFFLLPVFAFILKCLFLTKRIPYGAHLLFSFHYHAMLFVCLLVLLLPMPGIIEFGIVTWACLYLPFAMRTSYDIGWWATLWRCFILSMLYSLAIILALLGALAATVLL